MKICHVVGARPQFVKYLPLALAQERANREQSAAICDVLVHTGQHYDDNMSQVFFDELDMKAPDYQLAVGSKSQADQTAEILTRCDEVLEREHPDLVVVYGDTNSTLGAALAAVKRHIPIAHVEAGLRSGNRFMPEEVNRILTDHAATLLFCPSTTSVAQLAQEGIGRALLEGRLIALDALSVGVATDKNHPLVVNTGDVMFDVLRHVLPLAERHSTILEDLHPPEDFLLLTVHRAENTDRPEDLQRVIEAVETLSAGRPVIFPVHPRTAAALKRFGLAFGKTVRMIDPVGYFELLMLLKASAGVLTDSGGLQKEAFWMARPCITLRGETEWVETVEAGWNLLFGNASSLPLPPKPAPPVYGDGHAAERMVGLMTDLAGQGA